MHANGNSQIRNWFDATNFCERNKNQMMNVTEILHDLTFSTVTTLK